MESYNGYKLPIEELDLMEGLEELARMLEEIKGEDENNDQNNSY